jgi:predicted metal-binding membrane protein
MLIPLLLISLMLSAWVTLGIWGYSPYSRFLSHEGLRPADFGSVGSVLIIIIGWLIMIVAMMLPTSLPLLDMFARMTQRRSDHAVLVCLLIVGYLFVWVLFGIVAVFVDSLLHEAVDQWRWIANHDWFIGASLFGVAGLYQFTPLKYYCLDKCRSPMSFLTTHWRGRHDRYHAFQLGLRHGLFCLGCCWSLMLLMFAIGMSNLGWMFVLGMVMAIEKNVPWGRRFSAPLGVLLLCCGLAIVLEATLMTL